MIWFESEMSFKTHVLKHLVPKLLVLFWRGNGTLGHKAELMGLGQENCRLAVCPPGAAGKLLSAL